MDLSTQLRTTSATIVSGAVAERVEAHLCCFCILYDKLYLPHGVPPLPYFSWETANLQL